MVNALENVQPESELCTDNKKQNGNKIYRRIPNKIDLQRVVGGAVRPRSTIPRLKAYFFGEGEKVVINQQGETSDG
jgi:hypothetical protein